MKRSFVFIMLGLALFLVRNAHADYYKYTDKDGVICISDNLQSVPEQYRKSAVIVRSEGNEDQTAPRMVQPTSTDDQEARRTPDAVVDTPLPFSTRLAISGAIILGFIIALMALQKMQLPENRKKHIASVRTGLIVVLSLYLIAAHARDLLTITGLVGGKISEIEARSAEKGKKAGQAIKKIDALLDGDVRKLEQLEQAERAEKAP